MPKLSTCVMSGTEKEPLTVRRPCYFEDYEDFDPTVFPSAHAALLVMVTVSVYFLIAFGFLYILKQLTRNNTTYFQIYMGISKPVTVCLIIATAIILLFVNHIFIICEILIIIYDGNHARNTPFNILFMGFIAFISFVEFSHVLRCVSDFWPRFKWYTHIILSYGICNILWFIHRTCNCFIVSLYFVAIAPAQTIAAITLSECYTYFNFCYDIDIT